jgi:outer membrane protein TolC
MRALVIRRFFAAALAVALGAGGSARAERNLTLEDALAFARRGSYDLQAAKARLDQARTLVAKAWVALLPTLAAQGKYTHNYKEVSIDASTFLPPGLMLPMTMGPSMQPIVIQKEEQLDFNISLTVPLVEPYAYPALLSAKRSVESAVATYDTTESAVLYAAAQAFFAAAGADELVLARNNAIKVAEQTLQNARARLEAGVVNRVEVTRAELALLRAQQAAREAVDTRVQTYRALATLIQLREPYHVLPGPEPEPAPGFEQLSQLALKLRPEFVSFDRAVQAADMQVKSTALRWLPTISGFAWARAFNYAGFSGDLYAWAVGLQADWVLYDGGLRDAQRREAAALRRENQVRLAQLHDTVTDEVYSARLTVETKRQALKTAIRSVDLSKETLDLVRVQHDAGTATQLDVLTAQDALVAADVAVAQARFELLLNDLLLRQRAGLFPEQHHHDK